MPSSSDKRVLTPSKGRLLLLPNVLEASQPHELFLPPLLAEKVSSLCGLIAESEKGARRYLRRFLSREEMEKRSLRLLNEHTPLSELDLLLRPMSAQGETWGLISDCGLPCIADPGALLVLRAREAGVEVEAFAGPSSLFLALELSGFSGQRFSFHGYLPRQEEALEEALLELERRCAEGTQLWIEAPYRTAKMVETASRILKEKTRLCVAADLTLPTQVVLTLSIQAWRRSPVVFQKQPAIFLLSC